MQDDESRVFGLSTSISSGQGVQPYKYTGKELDMEHGLMQYDFEARQYDPAVGRFMMPDPLAEKYYSISPYVYCNNNPIRYIDPTGMDWYEDPDKNVIWVNSQTKNYTYNDVKYKNIGKEYQGISISSSNFKGDSGTNYLVMDIRYRNPDSKGDF